MDTRARSVAIVTASVAGLAACAMLGASAARPAGAADVSTLTYYAFDTNDGTTNPGLIPVPGTNPKVLAQGDELIVNDQLATTQRTPGGYPIVGLDAGVCTLTRISGKGVAQTLANCVVTATWQNGSLTVQGVLRFQSQQPQASVLAITGGTGRFDGAHGTVGVRFTKEFKVLTITLT
jgi:hypothetical protein